MKPGETRGLPSHLHAMRPVEARPRCQFTAPAKRFTSDEAGRSLASLPVYCACQAICMRRGPLRPGLIASLLRLPSHLHAMRPVEAWPHDGLIDDSLRLQSDLHQMRPDEARRDSGPYNIIKESPPASKFQSLKASLAPHPKNITGASHAPAYNFNIIIRCFSRVTVAW